MTKTYDWQTALINAVTDPKELLEILELDSQLLDAARLATIIFPLKIPRNFLNRIEKRNQHDPLLQQILPIGAELLQTPGYENDPLQEKTSNPVPGLLHKYRDRVLLTLTSTCAINCRYCFRRHFPYSDNNPGTAGWADALKYIEQNTALTEVILSGGDPLVATDATFKNLIQQLSIIPHIKRLRIHSRLPIVLPERITPELLDWIRPNRLKTILVVHSNHPNEINQEVKVAMRELTQAGVVLLNQSVLLKGINDSAETLAALSETLFDAGVLPYYLHVLDKVQGAAHFDISRDQARAIHWELAQLISGYLVPKLVCEQPGAPAKLSVNGWELFTD